MIMGLYNLTHNIEDQATRQHVVVAYNQALAYVWGRQDAKGDEQDNVESEEFAVAYGGHVRDYVTSRSFWQTNLQDAYLSWVKTGSIERR